MYLYMVSCKQPDKRQSVIAHRKKKLKNLKNYPFLWTSRSVWVTKENCYFGLQVPVPSPSSLCSPYASTYPQKSNFKIFFKTFYLRIFNDKKSLNVIILPIIWFLRVFCNLISALCSFLPPSPHFLLE